MKRFDSRGPWLAWIGLAALVWLPAGAQAQIQPLPELGLWETRAQMLVNGRDLLADMRRQQAEMLKQMPPAQRAQMEAMMQSQGGGLAEVDRDCVTAEDRNAWRDPAARLREMERDAPHCRFELVKAAGSTLTLKGRCSDPEGYTGDLSGTFTMDSARAWRSSIVGKGRMQGVPTAVDYRVESSGRWVAAQCPAAAPSRP